MQLEIPKVLKLCNLNELHKIDPNQITYDNLFNKLKKKKWHQAACKFNVKKRLGGAGWLPGNFRIFQITTFTSALYDSSPWD